MALKSAAVTTVKCIIVCETVKILPYQDALYARDSTRYKGSRTLNVGSRLVHSRD